MYGYGAMQPAGGIRGAVAVVFPTSVEALTDTASKAEYGASTAGTADETKWTITIDSTPETPISINPTGTLIGVTHTSTSGASTVTMSYDGTGDLTAGGVLLGAFTEEPVV